MSRLPSNKLIGFKNPDKKFHEKWTKSRHMLNFPHPTRFIMCGPPNSGKSTLVLNLILHAKPEFEEIIVVHCDPEYSKEYDCLGDSCVITGEVPAPDEFEGLVKTLVILDDLEFHYMDKQQKSNLDRLYGYVSTHKNISCCLCSQDPFNIPASVRRSANVFVFWKMNDSDSVANVARKTGIKSLAFKKIFQKLMTEPHDSLWIDLTDKSPMKLRKNGFQRIAEI